MGAFVAIKLIQVQDEDRQRRDGSPRRTIGNGNVLSRGKGHAPFWILRRHGAAILMDDLPKEYYSAKHRLCSTQTGDEFSKLVSSESPIPLDVDAVGPESRPSVLNYGTEQQETVGRWAANVFIRLLIIHASTSL